MPDSLTGLVFRGAVASGPVSRLAAWVAERAGWRRYCLALLLGALAAAAMPPVDIVPVLVVSFSGLVWLLDGAQSKRGAFLLGWCYGFGFFVAGLYWIGIALLTDVARFWWLLPFGVMGLPAFFAFYTGFALLACHWLRPRGVARIFALAVAWTAAEWVRGHALTGFPWNLVGYAWSGGFPGGTAMLQTTSYTGIYGLSLLTVVAAALPATLADPRLGAPRRILVRFAPAVVSLLLVAVPMAAGFVRLADASSATVPDVRLRLVQPSIPQTLKWNRQEQASNFRRHLALSAGPSAPGQKPPTAILWSEVAATYILNRDNAAREAVASVAPPGGLVITGALRSDPPPEPPDHIWNSLVAVNGLGAIVGSADKYHLVPFGEFMPLRGILPIDKITPGSRDFSAGPGPQTLKLPGLPAVGPLICYEVIFPGAVVNRKDRPEWMLNVTNDAWYGVSSGPFQHFAIARVRAVEEGLPLVRVANNGISGVIDAHGRVTARLALDAVGVIDAALPTPLGRLTPYARGGDWILLVLLLGLSTVVVLRVR